MTLKYYSTYLKIAPSSPQNKYKDELQQLINNQFDNASDIYTIQEEQTFGLQDWQSLSVRITHVLSDKNTSEKKDDDWRQIIFKDISHYYGLGIRYQFDNCTWITVQSDQYHYPTASAIVRRCNNLLKWYDSTNTLQTEPCIIDDKIQRYRNEYGQYLTTYEGYITVICQQNALTNAIDINKRFIFNGQAYKIINLQNYFNKTTYGNDSPLLTIIMNRDTNNEVGDNLTSNIANVVTPPPSPITPSNGNFISPSNITQILQGVSQAYSIYNYVGGIAGSDTFTITASGSNSSSYQLTVVSGNSFIVKGLGYDPVPLVLSCVNGRDGSKVQLSIYLKGLW